MESVAQDPGTALLQVRDLRTHIRVREGVIPAVDSVNFDLRRGEAVGLVGESGSGKTTTGLSLLRLLPPAATVIGGSVMLSGVDLLTLREHELRRIRGRHIAMIMQDPLSALNPVLTIGDQVGEAIKYHSRLSKAAIRARVLEVLTSVRIPHPEDRLNQYPHQFSGGMRQRIGAAMALAASPEIVIADEATTALDVTIQAQFLSLMRSLQAREGLALLWITHDLGVVAQVCDRVNIMYAGRIVESGTVRRILREPLHPYTAALLASVPTIGRRRPRLHQIAGHPPDLTRLPTGCRFYDRCPIRREICRDQYPPATVLPDGIVHCWAVNDAH